MRPVLLFRTPRGRIPPSLLQHVWKCEFSKGYHSVMSRYSRCSSNWFYGFCGEFEEVATSLVREPSKVSQAVQVYGEGDNLSSRAVKIV